MAVPSPSPFDQASLAEASSDKASLRKELRAFRRDYSGSLAADTRTALEAALVPLLEPYLLMASVVAAYQPMKDEISPLQLLERAAALGRVTALPSFVARDARMTFRAGEAVEPGPWGLLQPGPDAPVVAPDLILVPLIACDPAGNRIGMGQGHYDRALAELRGTARLVGIGWDFQYLGSRIAPDPWDQSLDAFVSPAGLKEFSR